MRDLVPWTALQTEKRWTAEAEEEIQGPGARGCAARGHRPLQVGRERRVLEGASRQASSAVRMSGLAPVAAGAPKVTLDILYSYICLPSSPSSDHGVLAASFRWKGGEGGPLTSTNDGQARTPSDGTRSNGPQIRGPKSMLFVVLSGTVVVWRPEGCPRHTS